MTAATKGYIELIAEILAKDAWVNNTDSDSRIALHYAIDNKAQNLDVVNLLIESGSDVNKETINDGFTPLITCIRTLNEKDALKVIEILNAHCLIDFIKCDRNGQSPI